MTIPYVFGQIAATNALSDVYAMGGWPISALALVCFPEGGDLKILEEMLAGGLSKMIEAHCALIGGHSIRDEEIKLGYAVTGTIHPQQVLANSWRESRRPARLHQGDRYRRHLDGDQEAATAEVAWIRDAVRSMTTLNKAAAEVVTSSPGFEVHGMTDVTGFGVIGHAREMAIGSGVSMRLYASRVPLLEGALECVRAGYVPGGLKANRDFAESCVEFDDAVPEEIRTLLYRSADGGRIADLGGGERC